MNGKRFLKNQPNQGILGWNKWKFPVFVSYRIWSLCLTCLYKLQDHLFFLKKYRIYKFFFYIFEGDPCVSFSCPYFRYLLHCVTTCFRCCTKRTKKNDSIGLHFSFCVWNELCLDTKFDTYKPQSCLLHRSL